MAAITQGATAAGVPVDAVGAAAGRHTSTIVASKVLTRDRKTSGEWAQVGLAGTPREHVEVGMVSEEVTIINIIACGTSVKCILAGGDPWSKGTPTVNALKASVFS